MTLAKRDYMGGLAKGLKVIEAFNADTPKLSITQAAEIVGLDRATTRRCLLTLADLGFCEYDGKFFTITPRILRLGTGCLAAMPLPRIMQPTLEKLSDSIQQSASVSILDETQIVYIARASQRRVMSIALMPGSRLPAYCTSMGRILLASLNEDDAHNILMHSIREARTPKTITGIDTLMDELEKIRQQGFSLIDEEVELGLRSIAVPLINRHGKTIAALNTGLSTTTEPLTSLREHYLPELLKVQHDLMPILH